jgi:hypothetical protein
MEQMTERMLVQTKAMQEELDLDQEKTITKMDANQETLETETKLCKKHGH